MFVPKKKEGKILEPPEVEREPRQEVMVEEEKKEHPHHQPEAPDEASSEMGGKEVDYPREPPSPCLLGVLQEAIGVVQVPAIVPS